MTNIEMIQRETSKIEVNKTLLELPNSELLTMLDRIRSLQKTLYHLASLLDGESIEVMAVTQRALKKISNEIIKVFAFRWMKNKRQALQNWENEGGKVDYTST